MRNYINNIARSLPYETWYYVNQTESAARIVYDKLGPGLKEKVYEKCLAKELDKKGLSVKRQLRLPVIYDGEPTGDSYLVDLMVEDDLIVEVKSVDRMIPLHWKQLLTYMKICNKRIGLLINFNCENIKGNIKRIRR